MVGSVDRHAHPDQPDPPGRPDAAREQPKPPRETEAQLAERLGLSTLTRASAYQALYAKAHAQDAPIRERLAREEREKSAESPESLTESPDASAPPIDKPERAPEAPRTYWTEVRSFLANWQRHADTWLRLLPDRGQTDRSDSRDRSSQANARADAAPVIDRIARAEPRIGQDFNEVVDGCSRHAWARGFEFRLKGADRIKEKMIEKLDAEPDRTPEEIVREIPDTIRYTCCFETKDYTRGVAEVKEGFEQRDYEMYYSENHWYNPEYKGINSRWVTAEGQRFEVQFHTAESFHAKHEVSHKAYERLRDPATSEHERLELRDFQRDVSSWIPTPPGVADIPNYKKEGR